MGKESNEVRKDTDPSILKNAKKKKESSSSAIAPGRNNNCVKANCFDPDNEGVHYIGCR